MSSPRIVQKDLKTNIISEYVKLNVGGMQFHTTTSTLTKFKGNMLAAMFSGRMENAVDKEGCVLIDRSGKHFELILNFLRDGSVPLPNLKKDLAELRAEAKYFCISQLVDLCDRSLGTSAPMNMHGIGAIYFIAMPKPLEENYIQNLTQPAIILEINSARGFPYCHVEYFEKLSFDFYSHILFIRYPLNNTDGNIICQWKFYTNGELLNNIVCNSNNVTHLDIRIALEKLLLTLIPKL